MNSSYALMIQRLGCMVLSGMLFSAAYSEDKPSSTPLSAKSSTDQATPLSSRPENFPEKNSKEAALLRGQIAFKRYCILCHGVEADGKGRAAKNYDPKPANLRESDKNTLYKVLIITKGGGAMGRSPFMPPWGEELTTEQITDIVAYLNSIATHPPKD